MLYQYEVPVAFSMVDAADVLPDTDPISKYVNYWIAFNSIYVTLAQRFGQSPRLRRDDDGAIRTRRLAGNQIPLVTTTSEREQYLIAVDSFDDEFKRLLISHPNTAFFVNRVPEWKGKKIQYDGFGQRVNGVINVGRTVNTRFPVWSPIETDRYTRYVRDIAESDDVDQLAEQIVDMLYTIRNNSMHGGKRPDHENDREVAVKAFPLLELIVHYFLVRPL